MEGDLCDFVFQDSSHIFDNVNLGSGGSSLVCNSQAQDDFSMFLHQIMYRSPSTNTSSCVMADAGLYTLENISQPLITSSQGFFTGDPVNMFTDADFLSGNVNKISGGTVPSSSAGVAESETVNEPDVESEVLDFICLSFYVSLLAESRKCCRIVDGSRILWLVFRFTHCSVAEKMWLEEV